MKKILNLEGIKTLNREEQQKITGAASRRISCCPTGRGCLISFGGGSFCEPGYCDRRNGRCIIY